MIALLAAVPQALSTAYKALPAILAALLVLAGFLIVHEHRAAQAASQALTTARQETIQAQAEVAAEKRLSAILTQAVADNAQASQARQATILSLKAKAHAAPPTAACASSPAIRGILDGLRGPSVPGRKPSAAPHRP